MINSPESSFTDYLPASSEAPPPGTRAIIDISVHTCVTSCGYSVPIYQYVKERKILSDWATKMNSSISSTNNGVATMKKYNKEIPHDKSLFIGKDVKGRNAETWLEAYWIWMNALSIDGLPGLRISQHTAEEAEKKRLLEKRLVHDQLAAPKNDVGPFTASSMLAITEAPVQMSVAALHDTYRLSHILLAFSLGCILTASLMLAQT